MSFGKYKKSRRALRVILENSDYENDAIETPNDYYELIERLPDGSRFFMFSNSPYLSNMNKLAFFRNAGEKRDGAGRFLYSNVNQEEKKAVMSYNVPETSIDICVPPDDLKITDPSKLDIVKISPQDFKLIRRRFVVKADKESKKCYFTYAIMYDKYILGGVGFEFFQGMDYDLWQLSDFCTNNNIPRLSKLILMCVLSVKMQKILSRRLIRKIKTVITYVYTKKPVSMKYRGIYAKCADYSTQNKLAYIGNMGEYQSMEEIVNKYNKYVQNAGK